MHKAKANQEQSRVINSIVSDLLKGHPYFGSMGDFAQRQIIRAYVLDAHEYVFNDNKNTFKLLQALHNFAPDILNRASAIDEASVTACFMFDELEKKCFTKGMFDKLIPNEDEFFYIIETALSGHPFIRFSQDKMHLKCETGAPVIQLDLVDTDKILRHLLNPNTEVPEIPASYLLPFKHLPFKNDIIAYQYPYFLIALILRDLGPFISKTMVKQLDPQQLAKIVNNLTNYLTPILNNGEVVYQGPDNQFSLRSMAYNLEMESMGVSSSMINDAKQTYIRDMDLLKQHMVASGQDDGYWQVINYQIDKIPFVRSMGDFGGQHLLEACYRFASQDMHADNGLITQIPSFFDTIRQNVESIMGRFMEEAVMPKVVEDYKNKYMQFKSLLPQSVINSATGQQLAMDLLKQVQLVYLKKIGTFISAAAKDFNLPEPYIRVGCAGEMSEQYGLELSKSGLHVSNILHNFIPVNWDD
jgi:hypothetical protein